MAELPIAIKYILTAIVGMVPIVELRGAIPVGVFTFHLNYLESFLCSFIGNIIQTYARTNLLRDVHGVRCVREK